MDEPVFFESLGQGREAFLDLVSRVRPELHRYCARLTGSVVDGEDVLQETLAKAFYAMSLTSDPPPLRPWLFRIAHNTALDYLRRYDKRHVEARADFETTPADDVLMAPEVLRASLGSFLELAVIPRSAVILKDVLGHSLDEAAETMQTTVPAVKAALVRGRRVLRAQRVDESTPHEPVPIGPEERACLDAYVALFNSRDWEGLRSLLAQECRLDLVAKAARRGRGVAPYFGRYALEPETQVAVGLVDGRAALLVYASATEGTPRSFMMIGWKEGRVSLIRDFRYVPYILDEASVIR